MLLARAGNNPSKSGRRTDVFALIVCVIAQLSIINGGHIDSFS
jgi:hypothetical protein